MTLIIEKIKELCELNSIKYKFVDIGMLFDEHVVIDDKLTFDITDDNDVYHLQTYIDIIKGRNEMVNTICDQLNTTIEKGCNFELIEINRSQSTCISHSDNSIVININNTSFDWKSKLLDYIQTEITSMDDCINNDNLNTHMENLDDMCFTKYEHCVDIKLKIVLKSPLEYYLIDEDDKISPRLKSIGVKNASYRLKSTIDLSNILNQLCTFEKKKCAKESCINMVDIQKDFPDHYDGLCKDTSRYMLGTAHGYRNKMSSFSKYFFCSKECMDYFDKYNRCHRCHEDCEGTYVEELGHTLCNGRGDHEPPCIVKYRLEQRFKEDYNNNGFYEIDRRLKNELLEGCDGLKQIIEDNGDKISYSMLMDLYIFRRDYELRDREEQTDKKSFEEKCQSITEELFYQL